MLESPEGYRLLLLRYKSMALLLKAIVVSTRNVLVYISSGSATILCYSAVERGLDR